MKVDTDWFHGVLRQRDISQRKLSTILRGRNGKPLDQASISLMLRGRRVISFDEARQLAHVLDQPVREVLVRAGIAAPEEGHHYALKCIIYASGEAAMLPKSRETIQGPEGLPVKSIAIRYQTARSNLALLDGWVLFAEKPKDPDHNMVSRLCLLSPKGEAPRVGWLLRGYREGHYNIVHGQFGPKTDLEGVEVTWAAPILSIQPQR